MSRHLSVSRFVAPTALLLALAGLTGCTPTPEESEAGDSTPVVTTTESPTPADEGADETPDAAESPVSEGDQGSQSQGTQNSGSTPQGSSGATTPSPAASSAPSAAPPAAVKPVVAVATQQCTSNKLKVTLTASADSGYRKGITSVTLERQNEYGAWISAAATWLGPETGAGDQWTGNPPGHKNQRFQDQLRITAVGSNGERTVVTVTITANC